MTKLEKIKEQLKVCIKGKCPQDCEFYPVDNCWMALVGELLKEQEPVKPKKSPLSMNNGYMWNIYDCGFCGSQLRGMAKYCDQCGKKVKWE